MADNAPDTEGKPPSPPLSPAAGKDVAAKVVVSLSSIAKAPPEAAPSRLPPPLPVAKSGPPPVPIKLVRGTAFSKPGGPTTVIKLPPKTSSLPKLTPLSGTTPSPTAPPPVPPVPAAPEKPESTPAQPPETFRAVPPPLKKITGRVPIPSPASKRSQPIKLNSPVVPVGSDESIFPKEEAPVEEDQPPEGWQYLEEGALNVPEGGLQSLDAFDRTQAAPAAPAIPLTVMPLDLPPMVRSAPPAEPEAAKIEPTPPAPPAPAIPLTVMPLDLPPPGEPEPAKIEAPPLPPPVAAKAHELPPMERSVPPHRLPPPLPPLASRKQTLSGERKSAPLLMTGPIGRPSSAEPAVLLKPPVIVSSPTPAPVEPVEPAEPAEPAAPTSVAATPLIVPPLVEPEPHPVKKKLPPPLPLSAKAAPVVEKVSPTRVGPPPLPVAKPASPPVPPIAAPLAATAPPATPLAATSPVATPSTTTPPRRKIIPFNLFPAKPKPGPAVDDFLQASSLKVDAPTPGPPPITTTPPPVEAKPGGPPLPPTEFKKLERPAPASPSPAMTGPISAPIATPKVETPPPEFRKLDSPYKKEGEEPAISKRASTALPPVPPLSPTVPEEEKVIGPSKRPPRKLTGPITQPPLAEPKVVPAPVLVTVAKAPAPPPAAVTRAARIRKKRLIEAVTFYIVFAAVAAGIYYGGIYFSRETRMEGQVIPPPGTTLTDEVWIVTDFRDQTAGIADDLSKDRAPKLHDIQEASEHVQRAGADIAAREERIRLLQEQIQSAKDEVATTIKQARDAAQQIWDGPGAQLDNEYNDRLDALEKAIADRAKSLNLKYEPDPAYRSPEVWANAYRLALYDAPANVDPVKEHAWLEQQIKDWRAFTKTVDDRQLALREQAAQIRLSPTAKVSDLNIQIDDLQHRIDATIAEEEPLKAELQQAQEDLAEAQKDEAGLDEKYYRQLYALPETLVVGHLRFPVAPNGRFSWRHLEKDSPFAEGENFHNYWMFARAVRPDGRQYWSLNHFSIPKDKTVILKMEPGSFVSTKVLLRPDLPPDEQLQ